VSDPLIAQYEAWAYPQPITDLSAYAAAGGRDFSDPGRLRWKIWPERAIPYSMNILVAGCGANQAAILAHANPQHRVTGIDLSGQAVAHHELLRAKHGLVNLTVRQAAVEDAGRMGEPFDYIVCTGVLHHLVDPAAGLAALRDALTVAPHGVISAMLYSQHGRAGIYRVQDALRALQTPRSAAGVALGRNVVANLPAWHHAQSYLAQAPDLAYDAGFVDAFLNARDRAYTVPQLLDLVDDSGLAFQGWLDELYYTPSAAFPAEARIHEQIEMTGMSREQQWHVVDLLGQLTSTHRFLLRRPSPHLVRQESDVGSDAWYEHIPHYHPDLCALQPGQLRREFHTFQLLDPAFDIVSRVDGQRTYRELLSGLDDVDRDTLESVFACLSEWGHVLDERP
jgi:hypothetical protein